MPEGPEIRRAADTISIALCGRIATSVTFGLPQLKKYEELLSGQKVISVTSHGKAMLTSFGNGLTIYSHNQLYGRWYIEKAGGFPDTNRQLRIAIHNREKSALLYSASEIEVLEQNGLQQHKFLSRLGPDVLEDATTPKVVLELLRSRPFRNRRLGNLLTDQSFLAGLGNYLRCEILFVARLHPTIRPCDCSEIQLQILAESITKLPRQSYTTKGITNDLGRAEKLMEKGLEFEEYRFHVFRRSERPCYHCGEIIKKITSGSQTCYLCETCQQLAS